MQFNFPTPDEIQAATRLFLALHASNQISPAYYAQMCHNVKQLPAFQKIDNNQLHALVNIIFVIILATNLSIKHDTGTSTNVQIDKGSVN